MRAPIKPEAQLKKQILLRKLSPFYLLQKFNILYNCNLNSIYPKNQQNNNLSFLIFGLNQTSREVYEKS